MNKTHLMQALGLDGMDSVELIKKFKTEKVKVEHHESDSDGVIGIVIHKDHFNNRLIYVPRSTDNGIHYGMLYIVNYDNNFHKLELTFDKKGCNFGEGLLSLFLNK